MRILHECEVEIDKSVARVTVWHHHEAEARRVMPDSYPRDISVYRSVLILIKYSFSCRSIKFK